MRFGCEGLLPTFHVDFMCIFSIKLVGESFVSVTCSDFFDFSWFFLFFVFFFIFRGLFDFS